MSKLNEDERDFVELALIGRSDVELEETSENVSIVKKNKRAVKKIPGYKKVSHWITALLTLPLILSGVFLMSLSRIESVLGAKLEWLTDHIDSPEIQKFSTEAGIDWLPQIVELYENKGIIIATVFTIPLLIIAGILLWDFNRSKTYEDEE